MRNSSTINSNGNGLLQLLLMAEEFIELISVKRKQIFFGSRKRCTKRQTGQSSYYDDYETRLNLNINIWLQIKRLLN